MTMRVGAVGNRGLCGFPRPCGRVLCVRGDGGVHALVQFTSLGEESDRHTESRIDGLPPGRRGALPRRRDVAQR